MDPKRKKIYIVVILLCILAIAGVLWWGGVIGGSAEEPPPPISLTAPTTDAPAAVGNKRTGGEKTFSAPAVFPRNQMFDTSVLDLSTFKALKSYTPPKLEKTDLGREDPFKTY